MRLVGGRLVIEPAIVEDGADQVKSLAKALIGQSIWAG